MVCKLNADVGSLPAAKQERLGRLLARTGTDGVDFANALDQDTLDSFLTIRRTAAPDGGEDVTDLTKTVLGRESNDLTDAEIQSRVKSVSTTYKRLDTDQAKNELARTIQESCDDGIYLAEEVSASRIQTLVDDGIDLKRHADGIGAYRRSGKTADDAGELTELFAQERVIRPEFEGSETVYPPRNIDTTGVKIVNSNGKEIAEFDGMTTDDGAVRRVIEVKKHPEKARDAKDQLRSNIDNINDDKVGTGTSFRLDEKADFTSISKNEDTLITVGPSDAKKLDTPQSNYDYYLKFSQDELEALSDTIQREGL